MVPDRIEREVVVAAPPERVWLALTDPDQLGSWFGESARIDLRPGGAMTLGTHMGDVHATVERVEPPQTFAYRWARPVGAPPGERNTTLVEFTLTPEGDGTRLRVVESGFRALDRDEEEKRRYAEENSEGWRLQMDNLAAFLERVA